LRLKEKIYCACVRSVMTYSTETWPLKIEDLNRLERAEMMMVRHMCGVTLQNRKSSEELRNKLGVENISDVIRRGRLRWFGQVERKEDSDWVKACQKIEINGERGKDRGRKTWKQCVSTDMKVMKLKVEDAQDRIKCGGEPYGVTV
jgi:hypothetical protein